MNWILDRLREPSTYRGAAALTALLLHTTIPDELVQKVAEAVMAGIAAYDIARRGTRFGA